MQIKKIRLKEELSESFWIEFDNLCLITSRHRVQLNSVWLRAYIETYLNNNQVYILAAYSNEQLVGCLPMQIVSARATRYYNFKILTILGNGPTDFYDIPIREGYHKKVLKIFFEHLINSSAWDKLDLRNIPESSNILPFMVSILKSLNITYSDGFPNGHSWVKTNTMSWKDYEESEFKPNNKDLYKAKRRLKAAQITLNALTYRENIYPLLMNQIRLYSNRRASLGQVNKYDIPERRHFLERLLKDFEKNKLVEFSTLVDKEGEVWAFQLDYIYNGIRYHWNHAYNEEFKRFSPGKMLLRALLIKSFNDPGIEECNHMRGLANYKNKFTNMSEPLYRLKMDNPKSLKVKLTALLSYIISVIGKK